MRNKAKTIRLAPFSNKYQEYLRRSDESEINCLEGAIRSGKTIVNLIAFARFVDNHPHGGLFLASGATSGLAWEILAECRGNTSADGKYGADQGFGLLYLFKGRCSRTKVKGSPAITLLNKNKKKCDILFVGAKNKGSTEYIRGLTLQGWIGTEIETYSVVDGDDFIGFALGRMTGAVDGKAFWDMNPVYPSHRVYTEYIDVYNSEDSEIKFNYLKCGMTDNSSLTEEQINNLLAKYKDKTSVMYRRDILGDRASANGLIFKLFATNTDEYILKEIPELQGNWFISIGIDFGGNGSNTAFCATLIKLDWALVIPLVDDEIDMSDQSNATVGVYRSRLTQFVERVKLYKPNILIKYTFCDSADTVMVNETRALMRKISPATSVGGCEKWTIKDRIRLESALLYLGHLKVYKDCTYLIKSLGSQVYNTKEGHEDERLDDGTCDVDIADASEYSWSKFYRQLTAANVK